MHIPRHDLRSFLDIYNEELRHLHEQGARFAQAHPQVALHLAASANHIRDPFVERLLEGSAFLTARVQQRLDNEQSVFAERMLARLAPGWSRPTPSIATVEFEPDFSAPQRDNAAMLPSGTKIAMSDASLVNGQVMLTTCRPIRLQPLEITAAACSSTLPDLPPGVRNALGHVGTCLSLSLSTRGTCPIESLELSKLALSFRGDDTRANHLLAWLLGDDVRVIAYSDGDANSRDAAQASVCDATITPLGFAPDEAVLPRQLGEVPGTGILRTYFASPSAFYGVSIDGVAQCPAARSEGFRIHLLFVSSAVDATLLDKVSKTDFSLFAAPVVNLHPMRCTPLLADPDRSEQHVVVDRLRPQRYEIFEITRVTAVDYAGNLVPCQPLHGTLSGAIGEQVMFYEASRRCRSYPDGTTVAETFLTLSDQSRAVACEVRTILVDALVCRRDFNPAALQSPTLTFDDARPVKAIRLLRTPCRRRPAPDEARAWGAVEALHGNPLRHALPDVADCASVVSAWLATLASQDDPEDTARIAGLAHVAIEHRFVPHAGPGPLAWVREALLRLHLHGVGYSDHGYLLFALVIRCAMTGYADLNQTIALKLHVDGKPWATPGYQP